MRIAIMGAGALGSYIGGRLAAADREVTFIARGAQLNALLADGLTIESPMGDAKVNRVRATADPASVGTMDLVVFLVKLYDTEAAARAVLPMLGRDTVVVSFQNGVDGWDRIASIVGRARVLGGTAVLPAEIRVPGVVHHKSGFARLNLGEFSNCMERAGAIARAMTVAGLDTQAVGNIDLHIWEIVLLATISGMAALTRLPIGRILGDPCCASLYERAMAEVAQVGFKMCPSLGRDIADRQMAFSRALPPSITTSMLDDLERGKPLELNDLSGAVVRIGRQVGIETPIHAAIQCALQPYVFGAPAPLNIRSTHNRTIIQERARADVARVARVGAEG